MYIDISIHTERITQLHTRVTLQTPKVDKQGQSIATQDCVPPIVPITQAPLKLNDYSMIDRSSD